MLRLSVWLVLLCLIFVPLEHFCGIAAPRRNWRARAQDLFYYMLSSLVPIVLLSLPTALLAALAQQLLPASLAATIAALPAWLRLLLVFLVGETGFYWGHRLSHEIPWLWRFHALHHSSEHMNFLAHTRAHPVDILVTRLFGLVPLYLLGLAGPSMQGTTAPALLLVVGTLWGFFIHANLRWRLGPLEGWIATPAFHHWHHSRHEALNRNYASTLPLLDRLFGSYHLPAHWPAAYGTDTATAPDLPGQLLDPLHPPRQQN